MANDTQQKTTQTTKDAAALRRIAVRYLHPDSPQQQEWLRIAENIETTGEAFRDGARGATMAIQTSALYSQSNNASIL